MKLAVDLLFYTTTYVRYEDKAEKQEDEAGYCAETLLVPSKSLPAIIKNRHCCFYGCELHKTYKAKY